MAKSQRSVVNTDCPNCSSGATQAARMVIAEGTWDWQGQGIAQGVGPDGDLSYSAFGGTSQSRLAAALDPGARPSYLYPVIAVPVVLGLIFVAWAAIFVTGQDNSPASELAGDLVARWAAPWWFYAAILAWLVVGAPIYFLRVRLRRGYWCDRMAKLDYLWVCQRCGCTWTP